MNYAQALKQLTYNEALNQANTVHFSGVLRYDNAANAGGKCLTADACCEITVRKKKDHDLVPTENFINTVALSLVFTCEIIHSFNLRKSHLLSAV